MTTLSSIYYDICVETGRACVKLYDLFGGYHSDMHRNSKGSPYYQWIVGGERALSILWQLLPYLIIKYTEACCALSWPLCGKGWRLTDDIRAKRESIRQDLKRMKHPCTWT